MLTQQGRSCERPANNLERSPENKEPVSISLEPLTLKPGPREFPRLARAQANGLRWKKNDSRADARGKGRWAMELRGG